MTKCEKCAELEKENAYLKEQLKYIRAMAVSFQNATTAVRKLNDVLRARIAVMRTKQERVAEK